MNDKFYGIALTATKLFITDKAIFIPETIYTYVEEVFEFKNGGYIPIKPGDVIRGVKSGATAIVIGVFTDSGSWDKSTMTGDLRIKSRAGQFINGESISIGAEADKANIESLPIECEDDYKFKHSRAKVVYVSVTISKDSLIDHAAVVISVSGNTLDYNYMMGTIIPESKKWVLYGDEIPKANFISFVQGAKSSIDCIGFF